MSSRRISLQDAFERLQLRYSPWHTVELLNAALRKNLVRLWCDDVLVSPTDILDADLYVRAELEADSRWLCTIATGQPQRFQVAEVYDDGERQLVRVALPPPPLWEVEAAEIDALLPSPPRRRGPKSARNWTGIVDLEGE